MAARWLQTNRVNAYNWLKWKDQCQFLLIATFPTFPVYHPALCALAMLMMLSVWCHHCDLRFYDFCCQAWVGYFLNVIHYSY